MKKIVLVSAVIISAFSVFAQTPQKLSYQAVIRNSSGGLVVSHAVGMKISILQGTPTGTPVYVETHTTTTNANGLVTIEIGGGSVVSGTFATINWASGTYYLKTEADPAGGSGYTIVGTSQLLSVPYALNSKTSESVADNSITSAKIADGAIASADLGNNSVTSAKIADAAIEAADLAANSVTTDKINAGAVTGAKIAQAGATNGQVLKWDGTTSQWGPAADALGAGSAPGGVSGSVQFNDGGILSGSEDLFWDKTNKYLGVGTDFPFARLTSQSLDNIAIYGISYSENDEAIFGFSNKSTGTGVGVRGRSISPTGSGVRGVVDATTGKNYGVSGTSYSATGYGVRGTAVSESGINFGVSGETHSTDGFGVHGYAGNTSGTNYGVYGRSESSSGYGVYGESPIYGLYGKSTGYQGRAIVAEATGSNSIGVRGIAINTNGTGIWGEGANQGVYGTSGLSTGKGVYGNSTHATGITYGVYGQSGSAAGYGVYGTAPVYGVYGICSSDNGRAVRGEATATSGSADGIYGSTNAANGCGVYGIALHATGETFGGRFTATSSAGTGVKADGDKYGVYGIASAIQCFAIYGETAGQQGTGVIGKATGTSSIGVRGEGTLCDFYAAGPGLNYESSSSVRWKTNIKPIPQPLEKLMALRGVYFNWDEDHGGQHDLGMIAEEVGKVLPEIVMYEGNGLDAIGMDYSKITPLLIEAIKAQQQEIESLRARLEKMEEKIGK